MVIVPSEGIDESIEDFWDPKPLLVGRSYSSHTCKFTLVILRLIPDSTLLLRETCRRIERSYLTSSSDLSFYLVILAGPKWARFGRHGWEGLRRIWRWCWWQREDTNWVMRRVLDFWAAYYCRMGTWHILSFTGVVYVTRLDNLKVYVCIYLFFREVAKGFPEKQKMCKRSPAPTILETRTLQTMHYILQIRFLLHSRFQSSRGCCVVPSVTFSLSKLMTSWQQRLFPYILNTLAWSGFIDFTSCFASVPLHCFQRIVHVYR